jgi:hypothetical protein
MVYGYITSKEDTMSGRFITEKEKREEKQRADAAAYADRQKARAVRDAIYVPQLDALQPVIEPIWEEFTLARELVSNGLVRLIDNTGFSLCAGSSRNMFTLIILDDGSLQLKEPGGWKNRFDGHATDLADVIADATKKRVKLTVYEPAHRRVTSDSAYEPAYDREIFVAVPQ